MSDVNFKKHRVFRETEDVIFYDISVEESNAADLVVHTGPAISPPNDTVSEQSSFIFIVFKMTIIELYQVKEPLS
ncbi:MAG: hypothetical protein CM15mV20_1880 [uncultured marine virus]|nr:MAG: hypothetical protein CM15mV20_1880 [uncultured marine virus]